MNITALNLPRDKSQEELSQLFEQFGKVESCNLVLDKETGNSKGFGFVEMKDEAEAKSAIAGLHGTKFGNNKIRVKAKG